MNATIKFFKNITEAIKFTISKPSTLGYVDNTLIINGEEVTTKTKLTTGDELRALRSEGKLIPGTWYRITDYKCGTTQEETRAIQHPFDVIVMATDEKTLAHEGFACVKEDDNYYTQYNANLNAWKVWFDLDADGDKYAWCKDTILLGTADFGSWMRISSDDYIDPITGVKFYAWTDSPDPDTPYWQRAYTKSISHGFCYLEDEDLLEKGILEKIEYEHSDPEYCSLFVNKEYIMNYYGQDPENSPYWQLRKVSNGTGLYSLCIHSEFFTEGEAFDGNGVIYRMIDEWNNDCPYDFKLIQFKRYQIIDALGVDSLTYDESGIYYGVKNSYTGDKPNSNLVYGDYDYFYTFAFESNDYSIVGNGVNDEGGCFNNIMHHSGLNYSLPNNVMYTLYNSDYIVDNIFGAWCDTNTFGSPYSIILGCDCNYNIVCNMYANRIADCFYRNVIGNNFDENVIGNGFYENIIGDNFGDNTIADYFYSNTIGYNFYENVIGCYFDWNLIDDDFYDNIIDTYFEENVISSDFNYNTIKTCFYNNTIGRYFSENTIEGDFSYNEVGELFQCNVVKYYVTYNIIGNNVWASIIENNCAYLSIPNDTSGYIQYITILNGTRGDYDNILEIIPELDVEYPQYIALNSQGELKIWNPADGGNTDDLEYVIATALNDLNARVSALES